MEALLVGLLLALVSGVTFVAYKHSFSYRRIIRTLVPPFPQFLLVVSLILFTLLVTLYQGALGLHNALDESLEAPVSTLASAINSHYNLATI